MTRSGSILTDIDSLFDTRLPIFYSINKYITERSILDKSYYNRFYNELGNISSDMFYPFYERRNSSILKLSFPTFIPNIILDTYMNIREEELNDGSLEDIKIYVNTYPYNISLEDTEKFIFFLTNNFSTGNINLINYNFKELDAEFIKKNNIKTIVMFSGLEWIDRQVASCGLLENPLVDVSLLVPKILIAKILNKIDNNYFINLREHFSFIIDLYPIDTLFFSCDISKLKLESS